MTDNLRDLCDAYLVVKQFDTMEAERLQDIEARLIEALERRLDMGSADLDGEPDHEPVPDETVHLRQEGAEVPGYSFQDFLSALKLAGYQDLGVAVIKWNLDDFGSLSLNEKINKMEQLKGLANAPVADSPPGDVTRCPRCGSEGKKFDWGYSCSNRECRRPNGKHTSWDEKNWGSRRAENRR